MLAKPNFLQLLLKISFWILIKPENIAMTFLDKISIKYFRGKHLCVWGALNIISIWKLKRDFCLDRRIFWWRVHMMFCTKRYISYIPSTSSCILKWLLYMALKLVSLVEIFKNVCFYFCLCHCFCSCRCLCCKRTIFLANLNWNFKK